jgi:tripartite ATP-independent transporter DctP family solute receptor
MTPNPIRPARPPPRAAAGAAGVLLLTACGGGNGEGADSDGDQQWSLGEAHPEDYPTTQADIWFADELRERSDGRIDITVFHGAQLGEESDVLEQVQLGAAEMTRVSTSPVSEFVDEWGVFALPYVFDDSDHLWRFLEGDYAQGMLEDLRTAGYVGLAYYDAGARNFYTTERPIRSVEDLRGLRIRTQQSQVVLDMMDALGADAVPMAFGEVYSGLQTGVIDGAENNFPSYGPFGVRHFEVAPYYTLNQHARVPEIVMISKTTWDGLSPEDQAHIKAIQRASHYATKQGVTLVAAELMRVTIDAEAELRAMLRVSLEDSQQGRDLPLRKGRRIVWFDDALSPLRAHLGDERYHELVLSVAATVGIETFVWLTDIARLSRQEAAELLVQIAQTLTGAAIKFSGGAASRDGQP